MGSGMTDDTVEIPRDEKHVKWCQASLMHSSPDVTLDDFVRADANIAEPCSDKAVVRKVQALPDCQESDYLSWLNSQQLP